jgi:hypothetical protein
MLSIHFYDVNESLLPAPVAPQPFASVSSTKGPEFLGFYIAADQARIPAWIKKVRALRDCRAFWQFRIAGIGGEKGLLNGQPTPADVLTYNSKLADLPARNPLARYEGFCQSDGLRTIANPSYGPAAIALTMRLPPG